MNVTPTNGDELADALRDAAERDQPVIPWGAGTLQHLGAAPPPGALTLHTAALDRIVEYNPADLTITAEAGVPLGAIQEALRPHGQWLPWDPPTPAEATIGGLLAAGASGPLRLGYGTPRDWVLGMRVALGDGRLVKSGGKVVKNVAGYDVHKLQIGALGTLGVIVAATFKVAPLPERLGSLLLACQSREEALRLVERLRARPLAPASLALLDGATHETVLAARFAGVATAVERQLQAGLSAAQAAGVVATEIDSKRCDAAWREIIAFAAPLAGTASERPLLIRAAARPAALGTLLETLHRHAPDGSGVQMVGYAGVGLAYARWTLAADLGAKPIAGALASLRSALAREEGYAVIEHAPPDVRLSLDLWGDAPATLLLMRSLKAQWDPQHILNRGRYIGGI